MPRRAKAVLCAQHTHTHTHTPAHAHSDAVRLRRPKVRTIRRLLRQGRTQKRRRRAVTPLD